VNFLREYPGPHANHMFNDWLIPTYNVAVVPSSEINLMQVWDEKDFTYC